MKHCAYKPCNKLFKPMCENHRYCSAACRVANYRLNHELPGTIKSIRQITSGQWSVAVHFPTQPATHVGRKVALTIHPEISTDKR